VPGRSGGGPLDRSVLALSGSLRTHLAICAAAAVVVAGAVLAQAEAISRLLPRLIDGDARAGAPLVAVLVATGLVRGAVALAVDRSATHALIETRTAVRRRILDQVARLRPTARRHLGPAEATTLTTTSIDALEPWVRSYLPGLVLAVVVPLAAGLRILQADLLSAVVVVVVVPLIPVFMILIGRFTQTQAAAQWATLQRLADRFLDTITGLPTLRLFGRAETQVARIRAVTERYRKATMRTLQVAFLSALVLELLATLSVALVAVSLGVRLTEGGVDLRAALVVLLLVPECFLPIRRVSAAFHAATAGVDAAAAVDAALSLPIRTTGGSAIPAIGRLEATNVSVTDPERGIRLAPVSVTVEPGEVVAVGGPSGSGKSTLLDVLRGAIAPDLGRVQVGSTAVEELQWSPGAPAIAWVPQHPGSLGSIVSESAGLGHVAGPMSEAAVALALDQVGLASMADADPHHLSGGERRRLALARALVGVHLGTTRFLLVDEPSAQLDEASADRIVDAIVWAAASGVGVVVATHDARLADAASRVIRLAPDEAAARPSPPEPQAPVAPSAPHTGRSGAAKAALVETPEVRGTSALRWLLAVARPHRTRLVRAQLIGAAAEACTIGLAGTAAWLIVRAAERPSFAALAVAAVAVRAFGLGKGVLRYAERVTSHDATFRVLAELRATVVGRLARLAPTGLPDAGRGELLTRLVDDVDRLQDLFLRVLGPMTAALAAAGGAALVAGVLDPEAGLVLAAAVLVVGIVLPALAYRSVRAGAHAGADARGALAAATVDLAEHAEELVACGGEPSWRGRIEAAADAADHLERSRSHSGSRLIAAAAACPALTTAAVVAVTGPAGPHITGPTLGVLVLLPLAVLELVGPLTATGETLARVEAAARRVRALLDRPDPVVEPTTAIPDPVRGDLRLAGVSLTWPGASPQVEGVALAVPEGSRAVITGPSGSGKSTIAAALVRFLAPVVGTYTVGGEPAADIGGAGVRRLVTWCQQDPWFADSTLADNLRIARPAAADEELWSALHTVHLDGWASRLPDGLATELARDAGAMSGGERQRLSLARALLGGQRAVVFDEPTAHLDDDVADAVLTDLLAATRDRAVVLIRHGHETEPLAPVYRLEPRADGPSRWSAPAERAASTPSGDGQG
jgi:ATP-binding cassette subfamily C protein CydCD